MLSRVLLYLAPGRMVCCSKVKLSYYWSNTTYSTVNLAYDIFETQAARTQPAVFILHALFSNKKTWHNVAQSLAAVTKRMVVTVDIRNHGDSPHTDQMDPYAMVEDIKHLVTDRLNIQPPIAILGHSIGGRISMTLALTDGKLWVDKLIVVDECPSMNPVLEKESNTSQYIEILRNVKLNHMSSLNDVKEALAKQIESASSRRYLLTNVEDVNGIFSWKFNIESIANNLDNLRYVPRDKGKHYTGDTIFIGGGKSNHIRSENYTEIMQLFPNAIIQHIAGAGHWIHMQKPQDFVALASKFLNNEM